MKAETNATRHIFLSLLLLLFSKPLLSQELVEFEDGRVAYADDINNNFAEIVNQITTLREDFTFTTKNGVRELSIDCDVAGRTALSEAITENTSINSLVSINAAGACSAIFIGGGRFRIVGSNGFTINRLSEEVEDDYLVEVAPGSQLSLIAATIDGAGGEVAFRNRGTTFIAYTSIKNSNAINFETYATAYTFGGVIFGDADDVATAALVGVGGVLVNVFSPGVLSGLTQATLTLRGADRLLWVRGAGYAALSLPDSSLDAAGGSIVIEQGGNLRLAEATIQLSDSFNINTNANVAIIEGLFGSQNTTANLLTNIQLLQGGTLKLDLSDDYRSLITHTGNLTAALGSSILVTGDETSPSDLQLGVVPEGSGTESQFTIETGAQLRIENAVLDSSVNLRSASLWLGNESVVSKGINSITSSFGAHVLVDGDAPTTAINCSSNGKAWALSTGESLCGG